MTLADIILWPGTKICEWLGVEPTSDSGLIRSMFNTFVYLIIFLIIAWIAVA